MYIPLVVQRDVPRAVLRARPRLASLLARFDASGPDPLRGDLRNGLNHVALRTAQWHPRPGTQHTIGFLILVTALPFLGPTPHFHLQPHIALFIGALVLTYIGVGLVGPTQSVLCLRILSQAGLSQQEVASALAAANVTFSTLGSLCGPLVAGALVPKVFAFDQMTSVQSAFTALCYLPALYLLGRDRPGPRPKPCGGCITCCSFLNSCCCPCFTCCQKEGCQWPSACCGERGEEELLEMEGGQTGTKKVT